MAIEEAQHPQLVLEAGLAATNHFERFNGEDYYLTPVARSAGARASESFAQSALVRAVVCYGETARRAGAKSR